MLPSCDGTAAEHYLLAERWRKQVVKHSGFPGVTRCIECSPMLGVKRDIAGGVILCHLFSAAHAHEDGRAPRPADHPGHSEAAADVQAELSAIRRKIEARLKDKILRSIEGGEMPSEADADALAGHIMAVIQGMSTLARDGAKRDKLLRIAETAMRSWPK